MWVLVDFDAEEFGEPPKKRVLKSFDDMLEAMEDLYACYMQQVLKRNNFRDLSSSLQLEFYGPNMIDAIMNRPVEVITCKNISADMIQLFPFSSPERQQLQKEMLRFYEERNAYIAKVGVSSFHSQKMI